jgi:hypothetical protein
MGFSFRWLERHGREEEHVRNGLYPEDMNFLPKHGLKGILHLHCRGGGLVQTPITCVWMPTLENSPTSDFVVG